MTKNLQEFILRTAVLFPPVALKNLLPSRAFFAAQQTEVCWAADELLLGSRFSCAKGTFYTFIDKEL